MSDLRRARLRFRAARHRLAAAALANDPRDLVEAGWALLRALDRLREAVRERPSRRDVRQWWRWLRELDNRRNDDGRT